MIKSREKNREDQQKAQESQKSTVCEMHQDIMIFSGTRPNAVDPGLPTGFTKKSRIHQLLCSLENSTVASPYAAPPNILCGITDHILTPTTLLLIKQSHSCTYTDL